MGIPLRFYYRGTSAQLTVLSRSHTRNTIRYLRLCRLIDLLGTPRDRVAVWLAEERQSYDSASRASRVALRFSVDFCNGAGVSNGTVAFRVAQAIVKQISRGAGMFPTYITTVLATYITTCMATVLATYITTCMATYMAIFLATCLTTFAPTCMIAYVGTYVPTFVAACMAILVGACRVLT